MSNQDDELDTPLGREPDPEDALAHHYQRAVHALTASTDEQTIAQLTDHQIDMSWVAEMADDPGYDLHTIPEWDLDESVSGPTR